MWRMLTERRFWYTTKRLALRNRWFTINFIPFFRSIPELHALHPVSREYHPNQNIVHKPSQINKECLRIPKTRPPRRATQRIIHVDRKGREGWRTSSGVLIASKVQSMDGEWYEKGGCSCSKSSKKLYWSACVGILVYCT